MQVRNAQSARSTAQQAHVVQQATAQDTRTVNTRDVLLCVLEEVAAAKAAS